MTNYNPKRFLCSPPADGSKHYAQTETV